MSVLHSTLTGADLHELLLADLRRVMGDAERMASADIVAALVQMEDRPWPEWRRGNPITVTGLARQLGPFGAKPKQLWIDGMNVRGYEAADLADAWARYLPSDAPPPDTPPPSARTARTRASTASAPNGEALAGDNSSASEIPGNPRHQGILADLADENPPAGRAHAEKAKTEAKAGAADDAAGGPEWRVEL
jgi:hypothetical protein